MYAIMILMKTTEKEKKLQLQADAERPMGDMIWQAITTAFFTCGIVGGAAAAIWPGMVMTAAKAFVCRRSAVVELVKTAHGNTTGFIIYCDEMNRTTGGVAVILAGAFLLLFWLMLAILLLRRRALRGKIKI